MYLFARRRQKGCDEMGEVSTVEEEFREALEKMISYCKEHGYLTRDFSCDMDLVAMELEKAKT